MSHHATPLDRETKAARVLAALAGESEGLMLDEICVKLRGALSRVQVQTTLTRLAKEGRIDRCPPSPSRWRISR